MKKQILIVEDDNDVGGILKMLLGKAGYDIKLLTNGLHVLKLKKWPDLIIMDRRLSGSDGLEICQQLRTMEKGKNVPVIIISATPGQEQEIIKAGANEFLEKPFNIADVLSLAAKYLQT